MARRLTGNADRAGPIGDPPAGTFRRRAVPAAGHFYNDTVISNVAVSTNRPPRHPGYICQAEPLHASFPMSHGQRSKGQPNAGVSIRTHYFSAYWH